MTWVYRGGVGVGAEGLKGRVCFALTSPPILAPCSPLPPSIPPSLSLSLPLSLALSLSPSLPLPPTHPPSLSLSLPAACQSTSGMDLLQQLRACCHTEIQPTDQTCYLIYSQYTDTRQPLPERQAPGRVATGVRLDLREKQNNPPPPQNKNKNKNKPKQTKKKTTKKQQQTNKQTNSLTLKAGFHPGSAALETASLA